MSKMDTKQFAGLFVNEPFTEILERVAGATIAYETRYDNAPQSDENGRWPYWFVGRIERAEKEIERARAELGQYVLWAIALKSAQGMFAGVNPTDVFDVEDEEPESQQEAAKPDDDAT